MATRAATVATRSCPRTACRDAPDAPPHGVAGIIEGIPHLHPRPAAGHARTRPGNRKCAGPPFPRGPDGPGDRRITDGPEPHPGKHLPVPDPAGKLRKRMSENPDVAFIPLAPDRVCGVPSPPTRGRTRGRSAQSSPGRVWPIPGSPIPVPAPRRPSGRTTGNGSCRRRRRTMTRSPRRRPERPAPARAIRDRRRPPYRKTTAVRMQPEGNPPTDHPANPASTNPARKPPRPQQVMNHVPLRPVSGHPPPQTSLPFFFCLRVFLSSPFPLSPPFPSCRIPAGGTVFHRTGHPSPFTGSFFVVLRCSLSFLSRSLFFPAVPGCPVLSCPVPCRSRPSRPYSGSGPACLPKSKQGPKILKTSKKPDRTGRRHTPGTVNR